MRKFVTRNLVRGVIRSFFFVALTAAISGLLSTAHSASITAYRDSSGRVVFVNEDAPESAKPTAKSVAKTVLTGAKAPHIGTQKAPSAYTETAPKNAVPSTGDSLKLSSQETARPGAILTSAFQGVWDEMIDGAANRHQVDPKLVKAIVRVESNFNPYAVSPRGAQGLMQLIPATAQRFGVRNVFDPGANLDGGVRYLKYLMNLYGGDVKLSLAAYNAGENAVAGHNGIPPYPETQDYLRKISEIYPLTPVVYQQQQSSTGIDKYVDRNGVVHFSNVDLP